MPNAFLGGMPKTGRSRNDSVKRLRGKKIKCLTASDRVSNVLGLYLDSAQLNSVYIFVSITKLML